MPMEIVEVLDVRQRGFANTDDSNLVQFDEANTATGGRQERCKRSGGHPACGATAEDHYF